MADHGFEHSLQKMFDEPPQLADSELFARAIEARLDRGWRVRQAFIGMLGLAAGVMGFSQMMGSQVMTQMGAASEESGQFVDKGLSWLGSLGGSLDGVERLPMTGEVMWMAAALGVMALGFVLTRVVEEF